jgi:hypothetical protein
MVMLELHLVQVLTAGHHFQEAGFKPLLPLA